MVMTFGHRIVAGIAACAVLGTGMALGSSPTARADWKGLTEVSHSRYVVSSDGSDVSVTTTLTITNVDTEVTPESPNGRWEYKTYTVNVPATAQNVQATSGGAPLQVTLEDAAQADDVFSMLMGEDVESRRKFIQRNAKDVRFLDI